MRLQDILGGAHKQLPVLQRSQCAVTGPSRLGLSTHLGWQPM